MRCSDHLRRAAAVALACVVLMPMGVLGQDPQGFSTDDDIATVPIPFALAPLSPDDTRLTLLVDRHDCGRRAKDPVASVVVDESEADVALRVEARVDGRGETCGGDKLHRLKVDLETPLGEREILDASTGEQALVNLVDSKDYGYRYACGFGYGRSFSVTQLLGPGLDISDRDIPTGLAGVRAMVDEGDLVVLRGPFDEKGNTTLATWRWRDGEWRLRAEGCRLMIAVGPGQVTTATWRLKGQRPAGRSKEVDIRVNEWACASGRSPKGRIIPPDVHYIPGGALIAVQVFGMVPSWEANVAATGGYAVVDCPGAPPATYTVKLYRRLGERTLFDAGYFPPKEVR